VKLQSVFLRIGCVLPNHLDPLQEPVGDSWMVVKEIPARVFDTMIRQAGWHFLWMHGTCSRRGFGITPEEATQRALGHALKKLTKRFNAAELGSVQVTKYPGFHIANVTLRPRQIQQHTSLDMADQRHPHAVLAR
jgi:hypothetical protein